MIRLMLSGLGWLLANLLFFMPRRRVEITLEATDRTRLPEPRREVLNPWLEQWYNGDLSGHAEKPVWVPYHFLFGRPFVRLPAHDDRDGRPRSRPGAAGNADGGAELAERPAPAAAGRERATTRNAARPARSG